MPSTDAPTWWADVQQEREDLAGSGTGRRPAEDWLGEDIDFAPRRRMTPRAPVEAPLAEAPRVSGVEHPLHGVFVPIAVTAPRLSAAAEAEAREAAGVAVDLAALRGADDPFATPPPPAGTRRTVHIKGRPDEHRMPSMAMRHRGRTASDRVGHRPDRVALWAVVLGAVLILVAATSSSSEAAVPAHRAVHAAAPAAKVVHAAPAQRAAFVAPQP